VRSIQPVNEISLKLLPPYEPRHDHHHHHHNAPTRTTYATKATTKAPLPERTVEPTMRPMGGQKQVEIIKNEMKYTEDGYEF
jgi:hypothetical protein